MAIGVGQAEQAVHAHRTLFVQQCGRVSRGSGYGHQPDRSATALAFDLLPQQLLHAAGGVAHRHVERVAGERQAGNRSAISFGPIGPVPALGPPALLGFLNQLDR